MRATALDKRVYEISFGLGAKNIPKIVAPANCDIDYSED